jgi:hypothetical protein
MERSGVWVIPLRRLCTGGSMGSIDLLEPEGQGDEIPRPI